MTGKLWSADFFASATGAPQVHKQSAQDEPLAVIGLCKNPVVLY
ncbi:hypothetical protein ACVMII_003936 [Bradyrhizobium diazoefficiens]